MKITIRKIRPDDIPAVLTLLREFAAFEKLSEYGTATEDRFQAALFGANSVVEGLVALDGERQIGYALFYPNFSSFRGERGMYLEDLYVAAEYRGTGAGKALLKAVAFRASECGYERLDFAVLDWNESAINFYRNLGANSYDDETHFKFSDETFAELAK